jgi:hypothetical protein
MQLRRNFQHFAGDCHLQVHAGLQDIPQHAHVPFLDMPPVFTQVQGDAVGPCRLRCNGRLYRVRVARAARLAQGCNMIDIYTQ